MKKILLFSVLIAVVAVSCKKYANPSITVTASFPTLTFTNGIYLSIPVNGTRPVQVATAYDSFYKKSLAVILIDSTVHTFVPGLYQATATAKNQYGYVTTVTYYVAVTNAAGNLNLSGKWMIGASDSFDNYITPLVANYYTMSNFNGVYPPGSGTGASADFAVIDTNTIAFTDANYGTTGTFSYAPLDTTMAYNGLTFTKYQ